MLPVNVKKLKDNAVLPSYESREAAGADLRACIEEAVTVEPGKTCFIPITTSKSGFATVPTKAKACPPSATPRARLWGIFSPKRR